MIICQTCYKLVNKYIPIHNKAYCFDCFAKYPNKTIGDICIFGILLLGENPFKREKPKEKEEKKVFIRPVRAKREKWHYQKKFQ